MICKEANLFDASLARVNGSVRKCFQTRTDERFKNTDREDKIVTGEITVFKTGNANEYLPQINIEEANPDFSDAVTESGDDVYSIAHKGTTVGLALMKGGRNAFLYVYVFPAYRGRGLGKAAALLLEHKLCADKPEDILTSYRSDDPPAHAFAKAFGYTKVFLSDHMVYSGSLFDLDSVSVRQYRDEDYMVAHSLYSEAFHQMRLSTGCFPDSVLVPPSDKSRKNWEKTANERLVYVQKTEIVGFAHVRDGEICSVAVKTDHQGQGIGKAFVKHIVSMLLSDGHKGVSLDCLVGNDNARHLYDGLGFIQVYRTEYAKKKCNATNPEK